MIRTLLFFYHWSFITWHRRYQNWWYCILFKVSYHQFNITFLLYIKLNLIDYLLIIYDTLVPKNNNNNNIWYPKWYHHWSKICISRISITYYCREHFLLMYYIQSSFTIRDALTSAILNRTEQYMPVQERTT
jgi:hypothetical protein